VRLWSIHPEYLDAKGLVALWREGLLAQKVLLGETRGYKNHSQLERFKQMDNPVGAISTYLRFVEKEANRRGYAFNRSKIVNRRTSARMPVSSGQVDYEFRHLLAKLKTRAPDLYDRLKTTRTIKLHPMFRRVTGGIEDWEVLPGEPD